MESQKASSDASPESNCDVNFAFLTGTVSADIDVGTTGQGSKCATMLLRVDQKRSIIVRVNAYERTADYIEDFSEGDRVMVRGELITRLARGGVSVTEIKAHVVSRLTA